MRDEHRKVAAARRSGLLFAGVTVLALAVGLGTTAAQARSGASDSGKSEGHGDRARDRDRDHDKDVADHDRDKGQRGSHTHTAKTEAKAETKFPDAERALLHADGGKPQLPKLDPSDFRPGQRINNRFSPLEKGTTYRYVGRSFDEDTGKFVRELNIVRVTRETKEIAGVKTLVVRDVVKDPNGRASEVTKDYYAQDREGNVWYLGEDTKSFEFGPNGKIIDVSREGSFQAGVNGARGGFIMLADPRPGAHYFQEHRPGTALDEAKVVARDVTLVDRGTTYDHVLVTRETTRLEPGVVSFKYYAPGLGFIREDEYDPDGRLVAQSHFQSVTSPPAR